jgi:hypothetical protein
MNHSVLGQGFPQVIFRLVSVPAASHPEERPSQR